MISMEWTPRPHPPKRALDGSGDDESRMAKRFRRLKLDPSSRRYLSTHSDGSRQADRAATSSPISSPQHPCDFLDQHSSPPQSPYLPAQAGEFMQVDDTPNRIFITNIDDELSDEPGSESCVTHPIFIGDIDKHLLGMPRSMQMLPGIGLTPKESNQLVLYRPLKLPELISGQVPVLEEEEHDSSYDADSDDSSIGSPTDPGPDPGRAGVIDVVELPDGVQTWNKSIPVSMPSAQHFDSDTSVDQPGPGVPTGASSWSSPVSDLYHHGPTVVELPDGYGADQRFDDAMDTS